MALLTLTELRALAAGADWIVHQEGCTWDPASAAETGCSCGATELRMVLVPLFDVAIATRHAERLYNRLGDLMADLCCGDATIEDEADDLLPAVGAAADAARTAREAALSTLATVTRNEEV